MSNIVQKIIHEYNGYQYIVNINHDEGRIYHLLKKDDVDVQLPDYITAHYGSIVSSNAIEQFVDTLD